MDQLNTSASAAQSAPSTASWDSWQETAVGYLHGFAMGLWTLVTYFFTPRVIFSHSICVALLWHLYRQGTGIKVLLPVAILEEVASYFLWWAIPNSWATILTLWASIYVYETLLGPKIFVKRNAVIVCDDDVTETLRYYSPNLKFEVTKEKDGRFHVHTHLKFAEYIHSFWTKIKPSNEPINADDVLSVNEGCDYAIIRSIRQVGAEPKNCFHFSLGGEAQKTVTFIADTTEQRDEWLTALKQFFGLRIDDVESVWLKQLLEETTIVEQPTIDSFKISTAKVSPAEEEFGLDRIAGILQKAKRKISKAYIGEIFRILAKKGSVNKSSNGEITGLDQKSFANFFNVAASRPEITDIFNSLIDDSKGQTILNPKGFHGFVTDKQKENVGIDVSKKWIREFETVVPSLNMTQIGFTNYLLSEEHSVRHRDHMTVCQDMTRPLSHYYIATSHNTYLTKDQLKGKSSVDAYISAFKRGCKCVELDCWDGPNNEPIIYHGHTLTSKILFKDVIQAIKEYAFAVSEYPVILSFENHCSMDQQRVMAQHLKDILQGKLYLSGIPEDEKRLPSPEDLKGYIIVKNKKLKAGIDETEEGDDEFSDEEITEEDIAEVVKEEEENGEEKVKRAGSIKQLFDTVKGLQRTSSRGSKKSKVPKIAQELSDLVSYCQATSFRSFDYSQENAKHYEMSSFAEKRAMKFAKEDHQKFIRYNKRQLSRIYPAGGRIDSSNYDPLPLWCVGCQLVALNYQTACREMQLNQALFQCNGGCGYVLKPEFLTREDESFNPFGPFNSSKRVTIRVISGSQMPFQSEKSLRSDRAFYVQLRVTGVEEDNAREKTRAVKNNGFNPVWDEELSVKLRVPELAFITLAVLTKEHTETFLGQFTVPFFALQQGYRNVPLQNKFSDPLPYGSLFVHVSVTDE